MTEHDLRYNLLHPQHPPTDYRAYGTGNCSHWFAGYGLKGEILRLREVRRRDISPLEQLRLRPDEGRPIHLWRDKG